MENIIESLSLELGITKKQVKNAVELIDEGNTIPFIARYRKEATSNLDDETLRNLNDRLNYLRNLEQRKQEVIRLIEETGNLTEEIKNQVLNAKILSEIEDIYRPFKPKKRTKATIAKEKGLEKLAIEILKQTNKYTKLEDLAKLYVDEKKGVNTVQDAILGATDIISEIISDDPYYRKKIRQISYRTGKIETSATDDEDLVYNMYNNFSENISKIPSHRILAINRGEKEEKLKVKISVDEAQIINFLESKIIHSDNIY